MSKCVLVAWKIDYSIRKVAESCSTSVCSSRNKGWYVYAQTRGEQAHVQVRGGEPRDDVVMRGECRQR